MKFVTIPHSDLSVSAICLGSMNWGQQNTEHEAHEQLDYAVAHEVNFIDTAEVYPIPPEEQLQGTTERYIGSWLKATNKRESLILASKVNASPIQKNRVATGKLDRASIRAALEGSLARLGTDYLDLYQIHWPERKTNFFGPRGYTHDEYDNSTPIEETLEALTELVKEGKIRYIGVSNETSWGVSEYLRLAREKNLARIVSIQNQYSLLNRTFEIGLAEQCLKDGVALLPYSPLSGGVLSGKYLDGARPAGARFTLTTRNSERYNGPNVQPAVRAYVDIAQKHGLDPAAMALAFLLTKPWTTSVIIGTTSVEQVATDIGAADLELTAEVLADIDAVYKQMPDPHS